MSHKLTLVLCYNDGTRCGLEVDCPPDVAAEIERKGLSFVKVQVDKFIQVPVSKGLELNKFKMEGG